MSNREATENKIKGGETMSELRYVMILGAGTLQYFQEHVSGQRNAGSVTEAPVIEKEEVDRYND